MRFSHRIHRFPEQLAEQAETIRRYAAKEELDFFETVFELLDYNQMNQVAAYGGFPQRYPHWRFGMEFERLRKQHSYGLGKIYEMVINNDPCYAYLLADNALVDQKIVMAHVYAHCDFFKNNVWFAHTNRKMIDDMANHATRIRRHVDRHGYETVERFIDTCLALEELIDPYSQFMRRTAPRTRKRAADPPRANLERQVFPAKGYMDRYINPRARSETVTPATAARAPQRETIPERPERDVMYFLIQNAPLADWQIDVLSIIRDEAYYFAPQGQTKIMNEGWATYWHSTIMTRYILRDDELITYCDHHAGTVATQPGRINPYKLGVELFRDIESRWNRGRYGKEYDECTDMAERRNWGRHIEVPERVIGKGSAGRRKIFEVRTNHNDITFIDEFLTPEFVDRYQMYHYRVDPATQRMVVVNRDFDKIKHQLLYALTNHGRPYVYVLDGNYANRGELYLGHQHNGCDLDIRYATETLRSIFNIWDRPVHLQARIDDEMLLFSFDGEQSQQQRLGDKELPHPAHDL